MPWSYWASFYNPRKDFACRLLHQQHQVEKEAKPLLRCKNVNEAIDKRKLFSSNTGGSTRSQGHMAQKKPAKLYRGNKLASRFARYQPCGESLEHNGLSWLQRPNTWDHEGSEKTDQTSLENIPLLAQYELSPGRNMSIKIDHRKLSR